MEKLECISTVKALASSLLCLAMRAIKTFLSVDVLLQNVFWVYETHDFSSKEY